MKKSYYAIIPANVRYDKELTNGAKLLYGEITALCNQEGYCWANNTYFAELYGVSNVTISKWVSQLVEEKYITRDIQYKEGTKEILNRYLRIVNDPIKENFNTPQRKLNDPIKENFKDNTTSNITFNNSSSSSVFDFYQKNFGVLSPFIAESIEHWINDLNEPLVIAAMERALKQQKKFSYAEGIMKSWLNENIKTIEDVEAKETEFENRNNKKVGKGRKVARF